METRGIWLPAPPELLSWLRSPPVQALPSPGTFTETLRYLHLFVLCCLHCICATGRHKWHRAIILIAHSHSALCSDQETDSGGVTCTDGHAPSQIAEVGWLWQIRDPRPLDSTVAYCAFCSKHCINVSILPNCWILPLFCEHKNGIWSFFFHHCHSTNKSVCSSSHLASVVKNSEVRVFWWYYSPFPHNYKHAKNSCGSW